MFFIIEQAFNSLLTFIIGVIFIRFLGIDIYGQYSIYIISSLFILNISYNLITAPCLLETDTEKANIHFRISALLCYGISIISSIALITVGIKVDISSYLLIPIYCCIFSIDDSIRKISLKNKKVGILISRTVLILSSFLPMFFKEQIEINVENKIYWFLVPYVTVLLGMQGICIAQLFVKKTKSDYRKEVTNSLIIYKENFGFLNTALTQWLSTNLVTLYAYSILSQTVIGVIKSAQNIASVFNFVIVSLEPYLTTTWSKIKGKSLEHRKIISFTKNGLLIIIPITSIICIFNSSLIDIIYPVENQEIKEVFILLLWLPIGSYLNTIIKVISRLNNDSRSIFLASILSSILSFVCFQLSYEKWYLASLPMAMLTASFSTVILWILIVNLFKKI